MTRGKARFRYWTMCSDGNVTHLFRWVNTTYQFEQLVDGDWLPYKGDYWSIAYDYGDLILTKDAQVIERALKKRSVVSCPCPVGKAWSRAGESEAPTQEEKSFRLQDVSVENSIDNIEPFGDLDTQSIAMHEIFLSLLRGGFTEQQAIQLIANLLVRA